MYNLCFKYSQSCKLCPRNKLCEKELKGNNNYIKNKKRNKTHKNRK